MNFSVLEREPKAVDPGRNNGSPATIALSFATAPDGLTHLARQYAAYPFHVCRPFRYSGDPTGMATVYVQSASGGIYEGERLAASFEAEAGAAAHVTSQASTIVHEMQGGWARQEVRLRVGRDALLEYLPDPLILFPDAQIENRLFLELAPGARAIVGDSFLAHDPRGKGRPFGRLTAELRIMDDGGTTRAADALSISGGDFRHALALGGRDFATHGTMALIADPVSTAQALESVRPLLEGSAELYGGASLLPGGAGLWIRLVAGDGVALRRSMTAIWSAMRIALTGSAPVPRRK